MSNQPAVGLANYSAQQSVIANSERLLADNPLFLSLLKESGLFRQFVLNYPKITLLVPPDNSLENLDGKLLNEPVKLRHLLLYHMIINNNNLPVIIKIAEVLRPF